MAEFPRECSGQTKAEAEAEAEAEAVPGTEAVESGPAAPEPDERAQRSSQTPARTEPAPTAIDRSEKRAPTRQVRIMAAPTKAAEAAFHRDRARNLDSLLGHARKE